MDYILYSKCGFHLWITSPQMGIIVGLQTGLNLKNVLSILFTTLLTDDCHVNSVTDSGNADLSLVLPTAVEMCLFIIFIK